MNVKSKTLLYLLFAYGIVIVLSYSTFLQQPVFYDEPIVWQSLIEQFITWIPITLAYFYLFKTMLFLPQASKQVIEEKKLFIPATFLLFISAFSAGIHAVAQLAEDFLIINQNTNFYKVMWVLDEYVGHLFLITLTIILFFAALIELNRGQSTISKTDKVIVWATGILNGLFWGIGGIEGGSMYIVTIPLVLLLILWLHKLLKINRLRFDDYIFPKYYVISAVVMVLVSILWALSFGVFAQPEAAGLHLFTF